MLTSFELERVTLRAADLKATGEFYESVLGFSRLRTDTSGTLFAASGGGRPLVELQPAAPGTRRNTSSPGLYHSAFLLPDRPALSRILRRIVAHGYPMHGAADHLVSHAIYLSDPEGNGVELYADLPMDQWPRDGTELKMGTEPLDVERLYAEGRGGNELDPRTVLGHVHLQVADLQRSEEFYTTLLGLSVTQRSYPGALFLAADGYHHHLGLNNWRSRGASRADASGPGLQSFSVLVPTAGEIASIEQAAGLTGRRVMREGTRVSIDDPDGITVRVGHA